MDLLEYQAKELFREVGIPVLPSQRIDSPRDLKGLKIPYPIVLKSQVRVGGRGKAGGVKFAENTIDAIAAASSIFNLSILGEYPQVLLAEAKYNADQEFYLAVSLDYTIRRPVLLGSPQGGINLDVVMQHMERVIVDQEFSPFYARRLAIKMGLQGKLIESVSTIVEKMFQLFVQRDLDIVEINPLGVNSTGEVMALDGKIILNDQALARHQDLHSLTTKLAAPIGREITNHFTKINWLDREGNIGIISNDAGLAIATLDAVYQANGRPAYYLIVPGNPDLDAQSSSFPEYWERIWEQVNQAKNVKILLVNILGSENDCQQVARAVNSYWQKKIYRAQLSENTELAVLPKDRKVPMVAEQTSGNNQKGAAPKSDRLWHRSYPQFVLCLVTGHSSTLPNQQERNADQVAGIPVHWMDDLDDAISKAVSLAKSAAKNS